MSFKWTFKIHIHANKDFRKCNRVKYFTFRYKELKWYVDEIKISTCSMHCTTKVQPSKYLALPFNKKLCIYDISSITLFIRLYELVYSPFSHERFKIKSEIMHGKHMLKKLLTWGLWKKTLSFKLVHLNVPHISISLLATLGLRENSKPKSFTRTLSLYHSIKKIIKVCVNTIMLLQVQEKKRNIVVMWKWCKHL